MTSASDSRRDWYFLAAAVGLHALVLAGIWRPESSRVFEERPRALPVSLLSTPAEPQIAPATPSATVQPALPPALALAAVTQSLAVAEPPATTAAGDAPPKPAAAVVTSAPRLDADYLHNPVPVYPPLSRRLREEGKVLLRVYVGSDGLAQQLEVRESSGFDRLDKAARDVVQRWRFQPARQDGQAVAAWVLVPTSFSLRSS